MPREDPARLAREGPQLLLPAGWIGGRQPNLADHPVERELQELVLAADVPVEGGRRGAELVGDAPHAGGIEPLGVDDAERGLDDSLPAQGRARRRTRPPPARPGRLGDLVLVDRHLHQEQCTVLEQCSI